MLDNVAYLAQFEEVKDSAGFTEKFIVNFRDIPEALTEGITLEEAIKNAELVLKYILQTHYDNKKPYPDPLDIQSGDVIISFRKEK